MITYTYINSLNSDFSLFMFNVLHYITIIIIINDREWTATFVVVGITSWKYLRHIR